MLPVYTPTASVDGFTETVTPPGAGAASPPSVSQFPALDAVAVKLDPAMPPENKSDCEAGTAPPTEYEKVSELGMTATADGAATTRVTGMVCTPAAVEIAMLPP
jgi:hypothetical protein